MNERIRNLIEQHERINNLYIIGPVQKAEVEDFVEAIVKACADEAFEYWCYQDDRDDESAQFHILQTFGVI